MNEVKCPHCGTVFSVDESEYANLVQQVRTTEFETELHERLADAEKAKQTEIELAEAKVAQQGQEDAVQKDAEIQRLRADLERATIAQALAIAKVTEESQKLGARKNSEIQRLEADLKNAATVQELAIWSL